MNCDVAARTKAVEEVGVWLLDHPRFLDPASEIEADLERGASGHRSEATRPAGLHRTVDVPGKDADIRADLADQGTKLLGALHEGGAVQGTAMPVAKGG